jgi:2',3'-cyclic-nucleotide 2'-phosphodiesterase (5'-nucleotidase family)
MPNLRKYAPALKGFVLFLTFLAAGCASKPLSATRVTGHQIAIDSTLATDAQIDAFIKPYRDHIDQDLSTVLAYAPQTLDKSGQWQCAIGDWMADVCREYGNKVFEKREGKSIDFCLLNYGGIRSIIPKGNVTARTAYEVMPFENSLIVTELKAEQVREIVQYILQDKKAHPISGIEITVMNGRIAGIAVSGKPLDESRTYYVLTSDYLANGGDHMDFFKKSVRNHDLDYKMRNVLIDAFQDADTIKAPKNERIHFSSL